MSNFAHAKAAHDRRREPRAAARRVRRSSNGNPPSATGPRAGHVRVDGEVCTDAHRDGDDAGRRPPVGLHGGRDGRREGLHVRRPGADHQRCAGSRGPSPRWSPRHSWPERTRSWPSPRWTAGSSRGAAAASRLGGAHQCTPPTATSCSTSRRSATSKDRSRCRRRRPRRVDRPRASRAGSTSGASPISRSGAARSRARAAVTPPTFRPAAWR